MAEQRKAAEETKTKELARQIQQEREQEELEKIAGKKSHKKDRGIDWMYQEGGDTVKEDQVKKQEEYLLGKEYVPPNTKIGDFANLEDQGGVNTTVASVPAAAKVPEPGVNAEPTVAEKNEAFRMRHEDPMFAVSQREREKRTQHDKKRALYKRVVGPTDEPRDTVDERRRSKKERKRKHRHRDDEGRRRKRRHRSRSRSRSSSRDRHRRRHRRSRSEERVHSLDYDREEERYRRGRSSSPSEERKRRYRSRSPRGRSKGDIPKEYDNQMNHNGRNTFDREPSPPCHHKEDRSSQPSEYGLHGRTVSRHQDLGPNQQLLDQRRRERDMERRRIQDTAFSRLRKTGEERAAALEAMQRDASKRDQLLHMRKSSGHDECEHTPSSGKASFLQEMAEQTHGIHAGGSLASRVAQNHHTNQKLTDKFL